MQKTYDLNVVSTVPLIAPRDLIALEPATDAAVATVIEGRQSVLDILSEDDSRLLVVVGPCSIHDIESAFEYAERLKALSDRVADTMLLVMRVYFEKPRTTVGWKGLINDPHLDDSFDIAEGLRRARRVLLQINSLGLPTAAEMLEPITPQYIADLVSLASIGARTTESPTHRQMASGLSMPVGYKNGTDGGLQVAINALLAGREPHRFLGIDFDGNTCVIHTRGNPWGHLILRGGNNGPNYDPEHLADAAARLAAADLPPRFLVDCSHANSGKDYRKQPEVWDNVVAQRLAGNDGILGLMLESNLVGGRQELTRDPASLRRGLSITDACLGWEETERLILATHAKLAESTVAAG
ncbi:MAG: 3-deoxy-7-phosphoheptulonate synthase [Planctomycetaceae bacterium]